MSILVMFLFQGQNAMTKINMESIGFLSVYSKAMTWKQELRLRPQRIVAYGLGTDGLLSLFSYTIQDHLPRVTLSLVKWKHPHVSLMKTCTADLHTVKSMDSQLRVPFSQMTLAHVKIT